jgi:signal transduction histidine kinase
VPEGRFPPAVEAAAYFVVAEALTNAARHAAAASAVEIAVLVEDGSIAVTVGDDGPGGAKLDGGGLGGLADRVAALGGRLTVTSPAGAGTTVRAEIPCEL